MSTGKAAESGARRFPLRFDENVVKWNDGNTAQLPNRAVPLCIFDRGGMIWQI